MRGEGERGQGLIYICKNVTRLLYKIIIQQWGPLCSTVYNIEVVYEEKKYLLKQHAIMIHNICFLKLSTVSRVLISCREKTQAYFCAVFIIVLFFILRNVFIFCCCGPMLISNCLFSDQAFLMNWIWSPLNIIPEGIFYRHFADTIQTHL